MLYDCGYLAQAESKRQRAGGRTNQVIICMLVPVVAAQLFYLDEPPGPENLDKTFSYIDTVLRNTSLEDVYHVRELERLGYQMSRWDEYAQELDNITGKTVHEFYANKGLAVNSKDGIDVKRPAYYEFIHHNVTARRLVHEVLALEAKEGPEVGFHHLFSEACANIQATLPPSYAHALMADNTATALYILLSHFPQHEVIF